MTLPVVNSVNSVDIVECDLPAQSVLDRRWAEAAYFRDAYRAPLRHPGTGVTDLFAAVFMHHPPWMKLALIVRNRLASWCGLEAPTAAEILHPHVASSCRAGDKIGVWPVFSLNDAELVAGRDNKHLDFRLSVLKGVDGAAASVTISTVCSVHNWFGKVYLFFVIPFHRWGVRRLIADAIRAGRL